METLARWLRGLLRRRSSPDQPPEMKKKKPWLLCGSSRVGRDMNNTNTSKKWSFRSKDTVLSSSSSVEEHHKTGENEHAVAVAAAAAEAAMVAAAEVLRLTKRLQVPKEEDIAALRIQAAFRGYLARRALLALKGLVRLQAVLRGHIARKRVVDMLRTATLPKARLPAPVSPGKSSDLLHIKSFQGPTTPEKYENTLAKSRSARVYTPPSPMVRKIFISSSKPRRKLAYDHHKNLLDQLMERRNAQLRPHERSIRIDTSDDEKITLKSFHSLFNNKMPTSSHTQEHSATSYSSSPEFPFKQLPIRAHKTNNRNPVPSTRIDCIPSGDTSPRISTSSKTDAFSVISNLSGWSGSYPSYMAGTASSRAKSRSRSAPRDRPEVGRPILMRQLPAGAVHGGRLIGGKSGCLESMAHSNKVAPMSSTQAKLTSKAKVGSSRFML